MEARAQENDPVAGLKQQLKLRPIGVVQEDQSPVDKTVEVAPERGAVLPTYAVEITKTSSQPGDMVLVRNSASGESSIYDTNVEVDVKMKVTFSTDDGYLEANCHVVTGKFTVLEELNSRTLGVWERKISQMLVDEMQISIENASVSQSELALLVETALVEVSPLYEVDAQVHGVYPLPDTTKASFLTKQGRRKVRAEQIKKEWEGYESPITLCGD
jgi:hypothetical protein